MSRVRTPDVIADAAANYVEEVETPVSFIRKRHDQIIEVHYKNDVEIGLAVSQKIVQIHRELCAGKRHAFIIFTGTGATITREARDFHASPAHSTYRLAEAVVVNNLPHRIIAAFYMRFHERPHPVKVFSDSARAFTWLRELVLAESQ